MLLPPILVLIASYLMRPAFVERYLLASFVPFFLLVALGIWDTKGRVARLAVLGLVAALALAHVYAYRQRPHDVQWREAVEAAAGVRAIAVAPPYAVEVVRYYFRELRLVGAGGPALEPVGTSSSGGDAGLAPVAIVGDAGVSQAETARIVLAYPHLRARLRGVIVRER